MFETKVFQLNKWKVYTNEAKNELMFTNGIETCYAYLEIKPLSGFTFMFDRIVAPKYIRDKAMGWAKKNMHTLN